nr:hypothetical protein [uncultured Draconibacterium sp.]
MSWELLCGLFLSFLGVFFLGVSGGALTIPEKGINNLDKNKVKLSLLIVGALASISGSLIIGNEPQRIIKKSLKPFIYKETQVICDDYRFIRQNYIDLALKDSANIPDPVNYSYEPYYLFEESIKKIELVFEENNLTSSSNMIKEHIETIKKRRNTTFNAINFLTSQSTIVDKKLLDELYKLQNCELFMWDDSILTLEMLESNPHNAINVYHSIIERCLREYYSIANNIMDWRKKEYKNRKGVVHFAPPKRDIYFIEPNNEKAFD